MPRRDFRLYFKLIADAGAAGDHERPRADDLLVHGRHRPGGCHCASLSQDRIKLWFIYADLRSSFMSHYVLHGPSPIDLMHAFSVAFRRVGRTESSRRASSLRRHVFHRRASRLCEHVPPPRKTRRGGLGGAHAVGGVRRVDVQDSLKRGSSRLCLIPFLLAFILLSIH